MPLFFARRAAGGCTFSRMEVCIQHHQSMSLLLRSCFFFSEMAVQKLFYLLYIFFVCLFLEKISPNQLACFFFWVAVFSKRQEEENCFFSPSEVLFSITQRDTRYCPSSISIAFFQSFGCGDVQTCSFSFGGLPK